MDKISEKSREQIRQANENVMRKGPDKILETTSVKRISKEDLRELFRQASIKSGVL